jgi:hypothetical protein
MASKIMYFNINVILLFQIDSVQYLE